MPNPIPTSGKDELRNQIYHKLDHLAEGAHRAFNNPEMYIGWIDQYTDELMQLIAASNQQAVQKALRQQADSITDVIAEFGDQVPLVFQIIDEKLNRYGGDYER